MSLEFINWLQANDHPVILTIYLALLAFHFVCLWQLFTKAGEEGWWAIIPFANSYKSFELFVGNGWLFLLLLIPYVNIVVSVYYCYKLSKSFGHDIGYTIGLICVPFVFKGILAFNNNDKYIGPGGVKKTDNVQREETNIESN